MARRLGAAPSPQGFGDRAAQAGARRVEKWCGQPELHRHRLIGIQASCSWTMTANERRGLQRVRPRRLRQKRTNTAANSELEFAPAGEFHGGSFGVSGTPPGA